MNTPVGESQRGNQNPRIEPNPTDPTARGSWVPTLPHAEIDELLAKLSEARSADPDDAAEVLLLIAGEAQRIRSTVTRLSMARLDEAEQEACRVIAEAHAHAEEVRSRALSAVDDRLDEMESLFASMRSSFLTEHAMSGNTLRSPRRAAQQGSEHPGIYQ